MDAGTGMLTEPLAHGDRGGEVAVLYDRGHVRLVRPVPRHNSGEVAARGASRERERERERGGQ